ncbi:enoyl-CoA hydratase-related protein, partial [Salmonella enterica]|uniref:enoyl-CoA hydratase-related protein n=1 Tax=Salmonella enterica TaxID=28901 RepID=UPI003097D990
LCYQEREGATAIIWMNEPKRRNPLSLEMRQAMLDEMGRAMDDAAVRAIVLTGAEGCFSAGGDIAGMTGLTPAKARQRLRNVHRLVRLIHGGAKP